MNNKRELFFDIVKGIGIISIVLGHVTPSGYVCLFVYMYHLAIFYFVSAYFYNEEKYGDDPTKNFGDRVKINWLKYILYGVILVLLHNTFVKYHFVSPSTSLYNKPKKIIHALVNTLIFSCPELLAGAMWFLPTLILALTIFGIIVYWARKISNTEQDEKYKKATKYLAILVFSMLCGWLGVYLNTKRLNLGFNIHTSFLVVPICSLGYFLRQYKNIIKIIKKIYVAIPTVIVTTAIIIYAVVEKGFQIELSVERIINGHMFYTMSFIGIAFCLSLAAIIEKIPILNKFIALLGKHSFAIMALHFAAIKLVDVVYSKMINQTNPEVISRFVTSYNQKLWMIYVVVGCVLPLVISIILGKKGPGPKLPRKKQTRSLFTRRRKTMSILVTGGAGYIGSHTVIELLNEGREVVIIDNFSNSKPEVLEKIKQITGKDFKFYEINYLDRKSLERVFEENKIEAVMNFAGYKAVGESVQKPLEYYENNISGAIVLLQTMKKYGVKKFIFSSSATVYGEPETIPITEDCKTGGTTNPYGTTKLYIEQILQDLYKSDNSWDISILRYFNPVGAHESGLIGEEPQGIPNNLMPYVVRVASGQLEQLSVFGNDYDTPDGTGVRDYIHVVDLAKGHIKALEKLEKENSGIYIYNLGTGIGYSVLDMVKAFENATGMPVNYKIVPRRPGDIATCYSNPKKAKTELNWEATKTLNDMCQDSWRYIQNQQK